jgi:hypothetical protein
VVRLLNPGRRPLDFDLGQLRLVDTAGEQPALEPLGAAVVQVGPGRVQVLRLRFAQATAADRWQLTLRLHDSVNMQK